MWLLSIVLNTGADTNLQHREVNQSFSGEGTSLELIQFPFTIIELSPPHLLAGLILWVCNQPLHTAVMCLVKAVWLTLIVQDWICISPSRTDACQMKDIPYWCYLFIIELSLFALVQTFSLFLSVFHADLWEVQNWKIHHWVNTEGWIGIPNQKFLKISSNLPNFPLKGEKKKISLSLQKLCMGTGRRGRGGGVLLSTKVRSQT